MLKACPYDKICPCLPTESLAPNTIRGKGLVINLGRYQYANTIKQGEGLAINLGRYQCAFIFELQAAKESWKACLHPPPCLFWAPFSVEAVCKIRVLPQVVRALLLRVC